eukprot:TRINITY_DN363_c0_g1_i1.p2 TRINITY_DN363_c0_g1~~TRINITY_DN363_c0_g1_i1.p2  ORF type:complete len:124 (-),score=34.98 TRINITY_DN363_c0_g1_i1:46-417(-)
MPMSCSRFIDEFSGRHCEAEKMDKPGKVFMIWAMATALDACGAGYATAATKALGKHLNNKGFEIAFGVSTNKMTLKIGKGLGAHATSACALSSVVLNDKAVFENCRSDITLVEGYVNYVKENY